MLVPQVGSKDSSDTNGRLKRCCAQEPLHGAKLGNAKFLAGAPEHVVEEQHERKAEAQAAMAKFTDALKRLDGAA